MQIAEGGAVKACKLIVSRVLSGSSETIRTVWSSQPTAWIRCRFCETRGQDEITTHEEWRSLTTFRHLSNAQCKHGAAHSLPVLILIQLAIEVKLKVDQLRRTQSHNDLTLVRGRTYNCLAGWYTPLVDATVCEDVTDTMWVDLQQCVGADLLHRKCGGG